MKKLNTIRIIAIALTLSIFQLSCKKALDLKPLDVLSTVNYWKTQADFKSFANGFYGFLRNYGSTAFDGIHSDLRSDFITGTSRNIFSNGTNGQGTSDGNYTGVYANIRSTNELLFRASTYANPADIAQFVAEAKFFRAYEYFELLQDYGDATIVDHPLDTDAPELKAARNTRTEVTDFILKDLDEAIAALPSKAGVSGAEEGRVGKSAAEAFQARVALYEGTWQKFRSNTARATLLLAKAATASKNVMTRAEYSLYKPAILGDSAQKYLFILEDTKSNPASLAKASNTEYMLSYRYNETNRTIGLNITTTAFSNSYWITRKFANMYLSSDGLPIEKSPLFQGYAKMETEFQNRDKRMRYTLMTPRKAFWRNTKPRVTWLSDAADLASANYTSLIPNFNSGYQNQKWAAERAVADRSESYDFPVIRYAEVLLTYAEAVYERDGAISDADLDISLNLVRQRINTTMPKLSNALVSGNGLDMRTEIRRERSIELYLEGFRLDDLKRWKTAETEMPMDLLGIKWTGTEFQTTWTGAAATPKNSDGALILENGRKWAERNYLLPLPTDQLLLNPNLKQNPGW